MKTSTWISILWAALLIMVRSQTVSAQSETAAGAARDPAVSTFTADSAVARPLPRWTEPPVEFVERDLSGPRVGFTIAPQGSGVYRYPGRQPVGQIVSQFGWHFEHQVRPIAGGPQLVTELIPLFGGVEYGKLVPSLTFILGVRLPSGVEFGMGPSFTAAAPPGGSKAGLVLAAGKSLDYGGICIPLNVAVSLNPQGTRFTLAAGYAIHRATR